MARVQALKLQAKSLKQKGDQQGAIAKLREAKALEVQLAEGGSASASAVATPVGWVVQVQELKNEAVALKRQGDTKGAYAKLNEAKALQAQPSGDGARVPVSTAAAPKPTAGASKGAASGKQAVSAKEAAPPASTIHRDLGRDDLELSVDSAHLDGGKEELSAYVVFSWELGCSGTPRIQTEPKPTRQAADKAARTIEWGSALTLNIERNRIKECKRFFERRSCLFELYHKPSGMFSRMLGKQDNLLASGELKLAPLVGEADMEAEIPLKKPGDATSVGRLFVRLRLRHSLNSEEPRKADGAAGAAGSGAKAAAAKRAAALPPEQPQEFVGRIVSFEVLEHEIGKIPPEGLPDLAGGLPNMLPTFLHARKGQLETAAQDGTLTPDSYLQGLREAILRERARAKHFMAMPEQVGLRRAHQAATHAKIMDKELKEAIEGGMG